MDKPEQTEKTRKWTPPRGIRLLEFPLRPAQPYGVQWRIDGQRKTKTFPSKEKQIDFAKGLAGDAQKHGVAAFRLNEDEARGWRAFRAIVGPDADLTAVAACWVKHKARETAFAPLSFKKAVELYEAAKKEEKVSEDSISHYGPIFDRFSDLHGDIDVQTVTADHITAFMTAQAGAPDNTKDTRFRRVRALFNWLAQNKKIDRSPFEGKKPPTVDAVEIKTLTLDQSRALFAKNAVEVDDVRRETLGRLALEAFAGFRNDTAAQTIASEIHLNIGLRIPAAKLKTKQPKFLQGHPSNLHAWLAWSKPEEWSMTPRQYATAKSAAFVRAGIEGAPRNCLRKGFATNHLAAFEDAAKTALLLCHNSAKMLSDVYGGIATKADGLAFFEIMPPATNESAVPQEESI